MANFRSPGVYFEKIEERIPNLALGPTGQVGFLGLTTRGPLHKPVRITSMEAFLSTYGPPLEGGYLADSVEGFFQNGGRVCYIVRVAHTFARGNSEVARQSHTVLKDQRGRATIRIDARNEGTWGNSIRMRVSHPDKASTQTVLVRDVAAGDTRIQVRSSRGFQVGTICKLDDGHKTRYITLNRVEGRELSWHTPLDVGFKSSAPTFLEPVTFTIEAEIPGYRERFADLSFSPLSTRYFERYINAESQLLYVTNLRSASSFPYNLPAPRDKIQLRGGHDGLKDINPADIIGRNDGPNERYGLGALEVLDDVDLIAVPDLYAAQQFGRHNGFKTLRDVEAVQEAMLTHCELLRDRFALLDVPPKTNYEQTLQWRLKFDSAFGALYFPWLVTAHNNRRRSVPPSGFVAGVIARSDAEHGVHKPPANEIIEGIVDLEVLLHDDHIGLLNHQGVNCIKYIGPRGIRIWGARTTSSDPQWRSINVRRTFNALRRAVEQGTQWVVFEPNVPSLWQAISRNLTHFFKDLWRQGFFQGMTPEEGYYILCDASTNPPENVDAGILVCEIGIAPVKPAEFIVFQVRQELEDRASEDSTAV